MRTIPNFLIVGAPRCGTTSLFRLLAAHPDVFMPDVKEIRYFDENFERGEEWYLSHFRTWNGQHAIGEASPGYMYKPEAVRRMASYLPTAKLLVLARNPVDRAHSHYWMRRSLGVETRLFEEVVDAELSTRPNTRRDESYTYLDRGNYFAQVQTLASHYSTDAIEVVLFEDLVGDPRLVVKKTYKHLGVDSEFVPSDIGKRVNPHVQFRSKTLRRMTKRAPRTIRRVVGRVNSRTTSYPPLANGLRSRLSSYFAHDFEQLEQWLDRDLSNWRE